MQQINLYQDEFRTPSDPVAPLIVLQGIGFAAAALFFVVIALELIDWRARHAAESAAAELEEKAALSIQLARELGARNRGPSLSDSVEAAEAKLASSIEIRRFLSELQLDNLTGFSTQLVDLARVSETGLRLAEFRLANGGKSVYLRGESLTTDAVPRFVQGLAQSKSTLREESFSSRIFSNGESLYGFELANLEAQ